MASRRDRLKGTAKAVRDSFLATASPRSTDTVRAFGADHVVDYTATTIAEAVKDPVDVVVNLVSGSREDTEALLDVTKPGGIESRKALPEPCSVLTHFAGNVGAMSQNEHQ